MTFPQVPRDVVADLFVAGGWVDITPDILTRDNIRIVRGKANEASAVSPSTCTLTLNNRLGKYSPRNPVGQWFGSLGRNTPFRLAVRTEKDTFSRSVSSGWGSTDTGGAWTTTGLPTVAQSDFNVASGAGTHSVPAVSATRISYLAASVYRDVDVSATVTLPVSNVLGGNLEPVNLIVSRLSPTDYFYAQVTVSAAEVVSVGIAHVDGTVVAAPVAVSGLTFAGQPLRARMQVEGQTLRAKVWDAGQPEPYAWTAENRSDTLAGRAPGYVGIRSGVAAANTNALPVVFSYDAFEVRVPRFAGEVSSWPQRWDLSGNDVYTPIEAAGPLRRLGQGQSPLKSTYRRGNETMVPPPLVYWPVEEGSASTSIASGIGGAPMIVDGPTQFAASSDFVGSAPIPKMNGSSWTADVQGAPNTGTIQTNFLLSVPSTGEADQVTILRVACSGSAPFWELVYATGGAFKVKAFDVGRALLLDSGNIASSIFVDGRPVLASLSMIQNGANIDWSIAKIQPGGSSGTVFSGTLAGRTVGSLAGIVVAPYHELTGTAIGHVMSRNYSASIYDLADQLKAYAGELSRRRINRLCDENNIPFSHLILPTDQVLSALMGPQRQDTLMNLIGECVAADMGSLYERRGTAGLGYRLRSGHYNQTAAVALDYSAGHISPPFQPVDDDQQLRNDITVTRANGSSYQATQTTGPLAVTDPSSSTGVGRYDTAVTLNLNSDTQVPDAATWLLHLGTVDEARYPTIKVNLAKLAARVGRAMDLSALSVNVDDRITIDHPKPGMDPSQISQLVRGYVEEITDHAFIHTLTWNCAPESPYEVMVLDSPTLGKLDSSSSTLTSSLTTTATSVSVTSTAEVWTTDPAEMPIPITIGGEDMTVTAITGATSPQTFTVVRSVNAVVKTHASGESVHLTRAATIAL